MTSPINRVKLQQSRQIHLLTYQVYHAKIVCVILTIGTNSLNYYSTKFELASAAKFLVNGNTYQAPTNPNELTESATNIEHERNQGYYS